jgi:hypothetical protein
LTPEHQNNPDQSEEQKQQQEAIDTFEASIAAGIDLQEAADALIASFAAINEMTKPEE